MLYAGSELKLIVSKDNTILSGFILDFFVGEEGPEDEDEEWAEMAGESSFVCGRAPNRRE